VSVGMARVTRMVKTRVVHRCGECGLSLAQWSGRCPDCGAWGSVQMVSAEPSPTSGGVPTVPLAAIGSPPEIDQRVPTGLPGLDRVLGGGIVPGSVGLLSGEPGIGKSTLLLQMLAGITARGLSCLLVSGEESHAQVAVRARRLGLAGDAIAFAPGRDLAAVLETAATTDPFLLAVDSIQTLRDTTGTQIPGGVAQVRTCTDALVGLAKSRGIAVMMTGHVTKDGDLAGPRALEHAVDVVLAFGGDHRSGMRVLGAGKNRFGAEGESAWFEMRADGLAEIDPTELLVSRARVPGAATALPRSGRRALAVEVQALVSPGEGSGRRHATGLDLRRFQLVAAVLDRVCGLALGRTELFGASSGGLRVDDPACDLAVAAALASAATGVVAPEATAFVGEVSLTGLLRAAPAMNQRLTAARAAGCSTVYAPPMGPVEALDGVEVVSVADLRTALAWARPPASLGP
jgi:DNA repair protein RadA/Sms